MNLHLTAADFHRWLDQQTLEYASETRRGERLRMTLLVRTNTAKVTHGDRVLYEGNIDTAIEAFNAA